MSSMLTHQPGKGIWTVLIVLSLFVRLPFLALYYLPRRLRPHPKWTHGQSFGNALCKIGIRWACAVRFRVAKSLSPGREKERFVVIRPTEATKDVLKGVANCPKIQPATIGGIWYPWLYQTDADASKKVILHFHGGAYIMGGARDMEIGFGVNNLIKATSAMVFCPQYRVAVYPNAHFPAALQDAVLSYKYLLDQGISASRIILSGDSAGGNLALALLRYLLDHEDENILPLPTAVLLWSPWLDLAADPYELERNGHAVTDYVIPPLAIWGTEAFIPSSIAATHPYISPARNLFSTKVPIFLQAGGLEVLQEEIVNFAKGMKEVPGNKIEIYETPFAPHDILFTGHFLGWKKEAEEAAKIAQGFLERHQS
jgi:acetyl esterase/lipase